MVELNILTLNRYQLRFPLRVEIKVVTIQVRCNTTDVIKRDISI